MRLLVEKIQITSAWKLPILLNVTRFLRADLINNLQENKHEILAFEDRMTTDCNIIICVIKIGNLTRQQAVLKCFD